MSIDSQLAIKEFGYRRENNGWEVTGTLGSFFKDDSICGYMDCETMFGTSEAGFAFSQTQKPDDNNIEIIV